MKGKSLLSLLSILVIIAGFSPLTITMAAPSIESNLTDKTDVNCADLDADLQVLVENEIISSSDANDALSIFYCGF